MQLACSICLAAAVSSSLTGSPLINLKHGATVNNSILISCPSTSLNSSTPLFSASSTSLRFLSEMKFLLNYNSTLSNSNSVFLISIYSNLGNLKLSKHFLDNKLFEIFNTFNDSMFVNVY